MNRRDFLTLSGMALLYMFAGDIRQLSASALPDRANNLVVKEKSIYIYTELNLKNVLKSNPHWGIVSRSGKLQDKAIFKAYCDAIDFHDALLSIRARPGNNLTEDNTGEAVKGDTLGVSLFWEGSKRQYSLKEAIEDTSGRGFTIKFGGNKAMAQKENTGCIMCLESCWLGITSNAEYPNISNLKRTLSPNSRFKGNEAILPKVDGHPIIVRFELSK
ncbi:MAG: YdjY domain-containing protein [Thermodesulfovibrionales bacterium]